MYDTPLPALQIKLLTNTAKLPTRGSEFAIGLDLSADLYGCLPPGRLTPDGRTVLIHPGTRKIFGTGVAVAIPSGYYGRVAPRSGLGVKKGIVVLAGVIDEDYRGELLVALLNTSNESVVINHGDRIAQFIMERADLLRVEQTDDLGETQRGAGGIGSTGA